MKAIDAIRQIKARNPKFVTLDIEVGIEKDTEFAHANEYDLLCVGIGYEKGKVLVIGENACANDQVIKELGDLLRSVNVVCQNGKFDLAGLYMHCGPLKLWADTMLAHYVLDERPGVHDLEQMSVEDLGSPSWKGELNRYKKPGESYAVIPREVLYRYNAYDVANTYDLIELYLERMDEQKEEDTYFLLQGKMVKGKRLRDVQDFLCEASNELMFVELNGIAIDPEYIDELSEKLKKEIASLEISLNTMLPWIRTVDQDTGELDIDTRDYDKKTGGVNPRSPKQLLEVFKDFGMYTQSTDADTCKTIIDVKGIESPIGRFCSTLLDHRRVAKEHGTYVEGIRKRILAGTDRVYTSFPLAWNYGGSDLALETQISKT